LYINTFPVIFHYITKSVNKQLSVQYIYDFCIYHDIPRRLGGVVVSVLATGPKGCGFEIGQGDGFLRAIKIRSTPSFGWEVKPKGPMS
jgi:hypothetical protein